MLDTTVWHTCITSVCLLLNVQGYVGGSHWGCSNTMDGTYSFSSSYYHLKLAEDFVVLQLVSRRQVTHLS